MEYRIAILRDKYEYLGSEYCAPEERKLAHLAYFPPLNYCCYPAVSEKYIVPIEDPWNPSEQAMDVMDLLDQKLRWAVENYPRRSFGEQTDQKIACLEQKAENRKRKLEEQGIRAEVLREEPFTTAQDSLAFHVYLMIWEMKGRDRLVRIETIE